MSSTSDSTINGKTSRDDRLIFLTLGKTAHRGTGKRRYKRICLRSALACEMAAAFDYTELYNIEGGTDAWIESNYPVE